MHLSDVTHDSGHQFQGQKVKGQLAADVLNSQHARIGATWRINTKILSTCRRRRHIVAAARLQLVQKGGFQSECYGATAGNGM